MPFVSVSSLLLTDEAQVDTVTGQRKQEANFLRFLRTTERTQNYQTLKIIGKGAFGEGCAGL